MRKNQVKKRKTLDIRDYLKSKSEDDKNKQDDLEAQMPVTGIKEKDEEQQQPTNATEEKLEAGIPTEDSVSEKGEPAEYQQEPEPEDEEVRLGNWEEGSFMEEDFWEKHLEKRRKEIEEEDKTRKERIERANREEKSWELSREIRKLIEETNGNSWFRDKELRKEKEKAERAKKMRLDKVKRKKREEESIQVEKRKQTTLLDILKKLPGKEREIFEMEERKIKRLEPQEIKTDNWRK